MSKTKGYCLGLMLAGSIGATMAQPNVYSTGAVKSTVFAVASIKKSKPGGELSFSTPATGFTARNTPLVWLILLADLPLPDGYLRTNRVLQAPAWVTDEPYDVDARLESPAAKNVEHEQLVRSGLRALLSERCKLSFHLENRTETILGLSLRVGGIKATPAVPPATPPKGISLGDDAWEVPFAGADGRGLHFYNTSMKTLAEVLSGLETESTALVQDSTGLQGRYDFTLRKLEAEDTLPSVTAAPPLATNYDISAIGLELKRTEAALPVVIVDHIERPTAN